MKIKWNNNELANSQGIKFWHTNLCAGHMLTETVNQVDGLVNYYNYKVGGWVNYKIYTLRPKL